jgi:hypothetical protein
MILAAQLRAQTLSPVPGSKYYAELGINLYALSPERGQYLFDRVTPLQQQFGTGVYYKRYFGKHVLRHAFNYYQNKKNYEIQGYSLPAIGYYKWRQSVYHAGEIRTGYQYMLRDKKFSPYFFTDVLYRYGQEEGFETTRSYEPWRGNIGYTQEFLIETHDLSVNPGAGFRWLIAKSLSVNVETQVHELFSIEKEKINGVKTKMSDGLSLQPLQISMGLVF